VKVLVELSGENPALAEAECTSVLALFGGSIDGADAGLPIGTSFRYGVIGEKYDARAFADRLALAHRVFRWLGEGAAGSICAAAEKEAQGSSLPARFDWFAGGEGTRTPPVDEIAAAYRRGGGKIQMRPPHRSFWLASLGPSKTAFLELIGGTGRAALREHRMPNLPFQRPVSLQPCLARAAVNLAGVRPNDRVADPFLGTGALLLEAGLVGARVFGSDRDVEMIRGAGRNFARFGISPTALVTADAADAVNELPWSALDAIVTDPPYGRASSTRGEPPAALVQRVLPLWAEWVRPNGRLVRIGPGTALDLPEPWVRLWSIPDRVHRSLTREFEVWQKGAGPRTDQ
jgi:putative methyltransferase (TIGR01177 family)